jgi:hypothetical protein
MSKQTWTKHITDINAVGSRVTCNPAPTDTDDDWLIYSKNFSTFIGDCIERGFVDEGDYGDSQFRSLRSGVHNLIVTDRKEFFDKFMLATHVCKTLNLLNKQNRIVVFQAILYGKEYGKP